MNRNYIINEEDNFEIWVNHVIICPHDNELHNIYPEAKKEIPAILKRQKKELKEIEELHKKIKDTCFQKIKNYKNLEIVNELAIATYGKIKEKEKLEKLIKINERFLIGKTLKQLDKSEIKNIPITNYLEVNSAGFARCPIHKEKTASLKYYPESNTFYCFGCHEGGDIIHFIQKRDGIDFISAVKYLSR